MHDPQSAYQIGLNLTGENRFDMNNLYDYHQNNVKTKSQHELGKLVEYELKGQCFIIHNIFEHYFDICMCM